MNSSDILDSMAATVQKISNGTLVQTFKLTLSGDIYLSVALGIRYKIIIRVRSGRSACVEESSIAAFFGGKI